MTAQVPDADIQLEGKADHRLQNLTLESMLRHMEEIQVRASPEEGQRQIKKGTMDRLVIFSSLWSGCVLLMQCPVWFVTFSLF